MFKLTFARGGRICPSTGAGVRNCRFSTRAATIFPTNILKLSRGKASCFRVTQGVTLRRPGGQGTVAPKTVISTQLKLKSGILRHLRYDIGCLRRFGRKLFCGLSR